MLKQVLNVFLFNVISLTLFFLPKLFQYFSDTSGYYSILICVILLCAVTLVLTTYGSPYDQLF